jgi:predicted 2-oxoglutarate/Fe(II)-dependent dioxygenase YbiX
MLDVLTIPGFLDPAPLVEALRHATANAATVYGGRSSIESNVRRTKKLVAPDATRELVLQRLNDAMPSIAAHFGESVDECEEPQFLRYEPGDFFVAHQDGNTPIIHDDTRFRRISLVIFLSEPSAYEGGSLVFHGRYPDYDYRQTASAAAGTLVAFRAETTHEVTPVSRGERLTIAAWYRARV